MATIKDVAKRAGVSISTVSRCINRSGYVGKKTREKIELACEELHFKPMQSARVLKTKKSNVIAFLVPTLRNDFFVELARYIERESLKANYKVVLCNIDGNPEVENSYIDMVEQHNFDGAIISTGTKVHKRLVDLPLVLLDRFEGSAGNNSVVTSDHKMGATQAVCHLVESGCKHILFVRPKEESVPAAQREEGYREIMQENGLESAVFLYDSFEAMLDFDYTPYDGIFVWNDSAAVKVLYHLTKLGRYAPKDFKLVGFDNSEWSDTIYPALTTIDQPYEEMAKEAVQMLIQIIENGKSEKVVKVLPTKLVIRETTE